MTRHANRFSRFGRSRWLLTAISALIAVVMITAVSLRVLPASANSAFQRPVFADKFANEADGDAGRLDLSFEQAYDSRAYPATEIPPQATLNAQAAFSDALSRGQSKHATGSWSMIGPSTANFPSVLTFSGAAYTTSGRITALAIDTTCQPNACRLWVAAAGGGIWRTDNALSGSGANWTFVSGGFATNAIGTLTFANGVLYAGTGEPNASGDSEAGLGIYASTDGGDTWSHLASKTTVGTYTGDAFANRSISSIVVDPNSANTIYVGSTRGVRGVSSVTGGAVSTPPAPRPPFGLFKSTDGGATFTFIWDGAGSARGVNHVALDPSDAKTVYAAAFGTGVWRSISGAAFTQIKAPLSTANVDRSEFAVTTSNGKTRMYVGDGNTGSPRARFFRTDDAMAAAPAFLDLTTLQNRNYCTGQCWYDNYVVSPAGHPDTVYLGGSYQYGEFGTVSNSRAVLYSTDAGQSFTDVSWDASSSSAPNGLHPDQHALVVSPSNPGLFFEGSDGGLMRSSGSFTDVSADCAARGLSGTGLALCQGLLSRVPTHLFSLNKGLSTLQFQSLSVAPDNAQHVQGGTQDNGTFETYGSAVVWPQIIYGDGGQSGFSATNSSLRFNTFTGQANDANFQNGDPTKWVVIGGPIASSPENSFFYPPVIADPNKATAGSIFQGSQSVWRTQDWGGNQAFLEANCPEFTASASDPNCGDFVQIGPAGATDLTSSAYGADRVSDVACLTLSQGCVSALARTASDTKTLWAATGFGRVFISTNANDPAGSVKFTRLDSLAANSPGRFVSSIYVDPHNSNHAWISYSGYNVNTPLARAGHVFEVTVSGGGATWTNLDGGTGPLGDLPVTGLVRDDVTGDLYAATDFGVLVLENGTSTWMQAGSGLPKVEVTGLTIVPGARVLYASTHGRSAWRLNLP
jgi:hypothetical protein